MKSYIAITITIFFLFSGELLLSQEALEVGGAIVLETSQDATPTPGTIRWAGNDFEGWDGDMWVSLTGREYGPNVTDASGNHYKSVKVGGYYWMASNLRTTKYNDGTPIPYILEDNSWSTTTSGARTAPPHIGLLGTISPYVEDYGYLYNGHSVATGKLCPSGWRIPSSTDMSYMIESIGIYLSENAEGSQRRYSNGGDLKARGDKYWLSSNYGATDNYGFNARGAGLRSHLDGEFSELKLRAYYWSRSSNQELPGQLRALRVITINSNAYLEYHNKNKGFSVRCIKT